MLLETKTESKQERNSAIPDTRQINRTATSPGNSSPVNPKINEITVSNKNCDVYFFIIKCFRLLKYKKYLTT